ncbi:MAG: hypothetical protein HN353_14240 [Bdellovibrionales bacterium]|jgi:hypothetical protein|nr:hypothetical protein [Bdellovibrionales bacterium]MBT3526999.1 hypothetical protein [Bdellovibrionales bacterium]MBT7669504.1 hypothetical protein [Bdellovibrionales bacterium]MBT7766336.1 hypothetical protein [Bdellovibrionales bacterium]
MFVLFTILIFASQHCYGSADFAHNGLLARAHEQFSKRDFTEAGINSVYDARYNYDRVVTRQKGNMVGIYAAARKAEANNFLATAISNLKRKKQIYLQSFSDAEHSLSYLYKQYGLKLNNMPPFAQKVYSDLVYYWALNIRGWVKVTRGRDSRHWKKIIKRFKRANDFGYQYLNYYGMNLLLSTKKRADKKYLIEAFNNTKIKGGKISKSGSINLAYADYLHSKGSRKEAILILNQFLKYRPAQLAFDLVPENRRALNLAQERLNEWGVQ